LAIEIVNISLF